MQYLFLILNINDFFLPSFWWPQRLFEKHFVWRFSGKYSQKQSFADVLKNFANVTGKHLFWSLLLIKLQTWRLRACDFIKKGRTPTQVFSCEICKIFKNTFSYRTAPVAASVSTTEGFLLYQRRKAFCKLINLQLANFQKLRSVNTVLLGFLVKF